MRRTITVSFALLPFILLLGWAAAGVALAGGGCHAEVEAIPKEDRVATVKIDGCTFAPTITRVPVGTEVRFINDSGAAHDITGRKFAWGSGQLNSGQTFKQRFPVAGLYPYSCSLHPGMAGVVVVGSSAAANDVADTAPDVAPVSATVSAAPTSAGDATLPIVAAGGLGILAGALVAGAAVSRRQGKS